jgi:hypothetical protein
MSYVAVYNFPGNRGIMFISSLSYQFYFLYYGVVYSILIMDKNS